MLRNLLSSRWFQGVLTFFVLCVGSGLLYSWHVQRTTAAEMALQDRLLPGREKQNETRPIESVSVQNTNGTATVVETPTKPDTSIATDATTELPKKITQRHYILNLKRTS